MPVRIEEINIKEYGPLRDFSLAPGSLTLVYGRNEAGKTFLVEFLLRCLFKTGWKLRKTRATGKVIVSGLENESVSFSPSSDDKLDKRWQEGPAGLPANMSRLLIVRGAEVELEEDAPGGASRSILKEVLSGQGVLDAVQKHVPKTVRSATTSTRPITGDERGTEIAEHGRLGKELLKLDELLDEADSIYSGGPRQALRRRLEETDSLVDEQEKAKRHYAYNLSREMSGLNDQASRIPEADCRDLENKISAYRALKGQYDKKVAERGAEQGPADDLSWAKSCAESYREHIGSLKPKTGPGLLVASVCLLVVTLVLIVMGLRLFSVLSLVVAGVLGWLYLRMISSTGTEISSMQELEALKADFMRRFGRELTNEADINSCIRTLEIKQHDAEKLKNETASSELLLSSQQSAIADGFERLIGKPVDPGSWRETLNGLREKTSELNRLSGQLEKKLYRTQVSEEAYLEADPGVAYDESRLAKLRAEQKKMAENISQEENRLNTVKETIARETGGSVNEEWEDLLKKLIAKRESTADEYRAVTAGIIAGKIVSDVVEEFRQEEDRRIHEGLADQGLRDLLFAVTGRYRSISLEDNSLQVEDQHESFALADLSTGAREQVLLVLRMAFVSKITGSNEMFLVLDDAFQYSDSRHRELLVDTAVAMAQKGWQIIYLTMDDHLRKLFREKGAALGDRFVYKELEE